MLFTSHNITHITHGTEQCLKLLLGVYNTKKRDDLSISLGIVYNYKWIGFSVNILLFNFLIRRAMVVCMFASTDSSAWEPNIWSSTASGQIMWFSFTSKKLKRSVRETFTSLGFLFLQNKKDMYLQKFVMYGRSLQLRCTTMFMIKA